MNPSQTAYKKSSFGPAFLFLDKRRRQALANYYAFCRLMDDIADEPQVENRLEQLDFWQAEINRVFEGKATTPLGRALIPLATEFAIEKECFWDVIDGMRADVQGRQYATLQELETYLWQVAGAVGLATLGILSVKGERARTLAQELGFAVQLTNIVRDVQEDAAMGRVYLPEDLLARQQMSRADVLTGKPSAQLAAVLKRLAKQAVCHYVRAEKIMAVLPRRKMLPCRIMSFVYQQNLAKIHKTEFLFSRAVKLTRWEKMRACLYAIFQTVK